MRRGSDGSLTREQRVPVIKPWQHGQVANTFFSDRLNDPPERDLDVLPVHTARGLVGVIETKVTGNWFARTFPESCPDGNGIAGTDTPALQRNLLALVPDAPWPVWDLDGSVTDEVIFDMLEYSAGRVELATDGQWHSFYRHSELNFDAKAGRTAFRDEVNQILQRGRVMYELAEDGQIHRLGTPEVQQVVQTLRPDTGDTALDKLITEARTKYASHRSEDRAVGLERLWDAFERLKTIDLPGGDKKRSIAVLLSHINEAGWRAVVSAEMEALTQIGNTFSIRHFETRTTPIPLGAADYLFGRMGSLMVHLLTVSSRLASAPTPDPSNGNDNPFAR